MLPDTKFKYVERDIADLNDMENCQYKFDLEDPGDISCYLGINFARKKDGNIKLTQTHIISQIIYKVGVDRLRISNPTPEESTKILHLDIKTAAFYYSFNYFSLLGMID